MTITKISPYRRVSRPPAERRIQIVKAVANRAERRLVKSPVDGDRPVGFWIPG